MVNFVILNDFCELDKNYIKRFLQLGNVNVVKFLLKNGAPVDYKDDYKSTAMHMAATAGNFSRRDFPIEHKSIQRNLILIDFVSFLM